MNSDSICYVHKSSAINFSNRIQCNGINYNLSFWNALILFYNFDHPFKGGYKFKINRYKFYNI